MLGRVECYYGDLGRCVFVAIGVSFHHLFADTTIMLHRAVPRISACITTYKEVVKEAASACGDAGDRAVVDRRSYCSFSDAYPTGVCAVLFRRRISEICRCSDIIPRRE